jgi:ribose transport system permease protein
VESRAAASVKPPVKHRRLRFDLSQENMVVLLAATLFIGFAIALPGFVALENLLALLQSVAVLGVLGIGMALVVIGRGIDLSSVAVMVVSVGWTFALFSSGTPLEGALLRGLALALAFGVINGLLVAYIEIPPIFATLAMSTVIAGIGQSTLVRSDMVYIDGDLKYLGVLASGRFLGLPTSVVALAALACIASLVLRWSRTGRYLYGMGDNPAAARLTGVPVRPITVLIYAISGLFAFAAGLLMATAVGNVNSRLADSMMVYDVILVVVIGGIGLSGGKGRIANVLAGTLLIGILLNGMTIMNLSFAVQNIIKSLVLLAAIVVDSLVNPRDEQTAQQGDI